MLKYRYHTFFRGEKNMNMFDEARSLRVMMDMRKLSQKETAKMLCVSQSYIANKLRLLSLDENVIKRIENSSLTERHARALLRLKGAEEQMKALEIITERSMTVAEAEALVDLLREGEIPKIIAKAPALKQLDAFVDSLEGSVEALNSKGIKATKTTSYYGNKMYITVCIEEN